MDTSKKICSNCNTELLKLHNYSTRLYDYVEQRAHAYEGWCLFAEYKLPGLFSKARRSRIVPILYVCPACHKLELYVSDDDIREMKEFTNFPENNATV